ncbi:hypothetical protein GCM10017579_10050 [Nocardioides luteus]|uniref:Uncharacterized protein n=1 Tax=Nocardioides luteus TaxID=1844 RepID=A0ABQ5SSS8_9ACTN|nr:hypothetical protein GCM10017579_10050 [Nocardioides luteus]
MLHDVLKVGAVAQVETERVVEDHVDPDGLAADRREGGHDQPVRVVGKHRRQTTLDNLLWTDNCYTHYSPPHHP